MLCELADLGFTRVELSHGIRISLVPGILRAVDEGLVEISSVHNFCPLPTGVTHAAPNLYQPSAVHGHEQALWYRNTLKTIDFAQRVRASLMVVHSGSVPFWWRHPDRLVEAEAQKLEAEERKTDARFLKVCNRQLNRVRRRQGKYRRQLIESIRSVLPAARDKGVRLGMENREGFSELPLESEMRGLLAELEEPDWIGYWHDAGHAELKDRLGLFPHRELLEENKERLFGFHLHDVSEADRDHQPLGTGVIDWAMVGGYLLPEHIAVLELSPRLTPEEVIQSRDFARAHLKVE